MPKPTTKRSPGRAKKAKPEDPLLEAPIESAPGSGPADSDEPGSSAQSSPAPIDDSDEEAERIRREPMFEGDREPNYRPSDDDRPERAEAPRPREDRPER